MAGHTVPRCPTCGEELVVEVDPGPPEEPEAPVLSADPPFRQVCPSRHNLVAP